MLFLLSPAKNLNFDPAPSAARATKPKLIKQTLELSETTRKLSRADLKRLMGISDKLADLNYERFQAFEGKTSGLGTKSAALAFNGEVYGGLDAVNLDAEDLKFAQENLCILSGLYGALRPLDAIEPYRLEMGTKLKNPRGTSLYDFWGNNVAKYINAGLKNHEDQTVINLASNEYFSVVDKNTLKYPVITPSFKEEKDGKSRMLMFYAKRARGMMARWAIQNRITNAQDLKKFSVEGYKFNKAGSDEMNWLFTRPQPAPKKPAPKRKK